MNNLTLKFLKPLVVVCLILVFGSAAFSQKNETEIKLKAIDFLKKNEPDMEKNPDLYRQFDLLSDLALAALSAGDNKKAEDYARRLLAITKDNESQIGIDPGKVGYAIHSGNIVLGYVALDKGDTEKAKDYLLAAGKVTGQPRTLISFGPDMSLAKKLIEKNERETVIQYFDLCAKFWKMGGEDLAGWTNIVKKGGMPDFRANLVYVVEGWTTPG